MYFLWADGCVILTQDSICHLFYSDPCCPSDPREVLRHSGVDAVLPILGTILPPAHNARQEPGAFVIGGMWSSAVPLTCILLYILKTCTEHKARDAMPAALFTLGAFHVWDLKLLKLGGLWALELQPSPAAHYGATGLSQ